MVGEKGWWEAEDEAEASPPEEQDLFRLPGQAETEASLMFPPDSFKPDDEVEVRAGEPVILIMAGLLFLIWLYVRNRISSSDNLFTEICCGLLFRVLF